MLEKYDEVLSVDDVCEILHFGRNKVYEMLQNGDIPNKKIRRRYIIPKRGLINFLKYIEKNNN